MDKIQKLLSKLSEKDKTTVKKILKQLHSKNTKNLDIKKLKGLSNLFRVRKGDIRIIYTLDHSEIRLFKIDKRKEDTYKF